MITSYSKKRHLPAISFGVSNPFINDKTPTNPSQGEPKLLESYISDNDPFLVRVRELIDDEFAGVILFGPPGTGKSWYGREIAKKISGLNSENSFFVQFHPTYQYEDFVEGYTPDGHGNFICEEKIFLRACSRAMQTNDTVILLIDELSRADCIRVFGEILTYIEFSKRNIPFTLSSGKTHFVPKNLFLIMTMNPWDRGVEEVDLAFERRFAKIHIGPNVDILRVFLEKNNIDDELSLRITQFYHMIANHKNPLCRIGHTYFSRVKSIESLKRLWENQLMFHFNKVLKHDPDEIEIIQAAWNRIFIGYN